MKYADWIKTLTPEILALWEWDEERDILYIKPRQGPPQCPVAPLLPAYDPQFDYEPQSEEERRLDAEERLLDAAARDRFSDDGLPVRAIGALIHAGCRSAEDAANLHEIDLLIIPNCGEKTVAAIEKWLEEHGLHLRHRRCKTCGQLIP